MNKDLLKLVCILSSILFFSFAVSKSINSKHLVERKFSFNSGIIYINHESDWSDNYYVVYRFRMFEQDEPLKSFVGDGYNEMMKFYLRAE